MFRDRTRYHFELISSSEHPHYDTPQVAPTTERLLVELLAATKQRLAGCFEVFQVGALTLGWVSRKYGPLARNHASTQTLVRFPEVWQRDTLRCRQQRAAN